jgi:hypothetical protein
MIGFKTIETRGERLGRSDLESKRIHSQVELSAGIHKRKVRMKVKIADQIFISAKWMGAVCIWYCAKATQVGEY